MEKADVERVKKLVIDELVPMLTALEGKVMLALKMAVTDFRSEIGNDHSENRTRTQNLQATVDETQKLVRDLLRTLGVREGEDIANAKHKANRNGLIKAGLALVGTGGIVAGWKWLVALVHAK